MEWVDEIERLSNIIEKAKVIAGDTDHFIEVDPLGDLRKLQDILWERA